MLPCALRLFSSMILLILSLAFLVLPRALFAEDSPHPPSNPGQLVAIVVVNRHGDRAPQNNAPAYAAGTRLSLQHNFPFDNHSVWPVDYGQLTGLGMQQTQAFGAYLRKRYVSGEHGPNPGPWNMLLNPVYNHKETHARSTDVDRTLVSAMGIMSGLYPPGVGPEGQTDPLGKVEMVPIHTVAYTTDALMDGSSSAHCPKFAKASKHHLKHDHGLHSLIVKNQKLIDALPALTGKSRTEIDKLVSSKKHIKSLIKIIAALRDLRVCQKAHDVSVPKNVSRFDDDLEKITARTVHTKWDSTGLGPLVGGRLLRAISVRFHTLIAFLAKEPWAIKKFVEECNSKGTDSDEDGGCPRKMVLYTGHDTTIFDLRAALGIPVLVQGIAPYVAHLIFELRLLKTNTSHNAKDPVNQNAFSVTILSGNYNKTALPIAGPFCNGQVTCSFPTFVNYVNKTVPVDINEACGIKEKKQSEDELDEDDPEQLIQDSLQTATKTAQTLYQHNHYTWGSVASGLLTAIIVTAAFMFLIERFIITVRRQKQYHIL